MSVQLALFPEVVELTRVRPEMNERRFYSLEIQPDLFGRTLLVQRWGRIGTSGRQRLELHPDAGTALSALTQLARNKRRRGYREHQVGHGCRNRPFRFRPLAVQLEGRRPQGGDMKWKRWSPIIQGG